LIGRMGKANYEALKAKALKATKPDYEAVLAQLKSL
jgi:hypothetical protein